VSTRTRLASSRGPGTRHLGATAASISCLPYFPWRQREDQVMLAHAPSPVAVTVAHTNRDRHAILLTRSLFYP